MSNDKIFDILILAALPASGKSEVRRYLRNLSDEERTNSFHMGPNLQLDDFPYVHLMRVIDEELKKAGKEYIFYLNPDDVFQDNREWGTLMELLNEDYVDLMEKRDISPSSLGQYYMERIEKSAEKVGIPSRLANLDKDLYQTIAQNIEAECAKMFEYKMRQHKEELEGKTIIMEFARGGPDGAAMPLTDANGYEYSLSILSPEILKRAVIVYIWVTPEESRRKNSNRSDPNNPGSILHHGVPIDVMMKNYGCDDINWLEEQSEKPGTVTIKQNDKTFFIPVAKFDNRTDKTSFLRGEPKEWPPENLEIIHNELKQACDKLLSEL